MWWMILIVDSDSRVFFRLSFRPQKKLISLNISSSFYHDLFIDHDPLKIILSLVSLNQIVRELKSPPTTSLNRDFFEINLCFEIFK